MISTQEAEEADNKQHWNSFNQFCNSDKIGKINRTMQF